MASTRSTTSRSNPTPGTSHSESNPHRGPPQPLPPEPVRCRLARDCPPHHHLRQPTHTTAVSSPTWRRPKFPVWPTSIAPPPVLKLSLPPGQPPDYTAPQIPKRTFQPMKARA
ncbi:hypothetical protein BR93DRAFT_926515 [Coniochaeta sp. PMI_546]|nr:hypothetical protein BR93DRAFT_926515 [Coniochaeta sp. PMI_546]